jgi:hypothetical protein
MSIDPPSHELPTDELSTELEMYADIFTITMNSTSYAAALTICELLARMVSWYQYDHFPCPITVDMYRCFMQHTTDLSILFGERVPPPSVMWTSSYLKPRVYRVTQQIRCGWLETRSPKFNSRLIKFVYELSLLEKRKVDNIDKNE